VDQGVEPHETALQDLGEQPVKLWNSFVSKFKVNGIKRLGAGAILGHSSAANVYHCCVHKTGSQWIRKLLSDPVVYRYSDLSPYHYQSRLPGQRDSRDIKDRTFAEPFPTGTIVSPLYISFENFSALPKPENYRAFFVQRDPRDILVSWYFSMKHSHPVSGRIQQLRQDLNAMSVDDGILYTMNHLHRSGHFQVIASWIDAPKRNPNTIVVRFEDLIGPASVEVFDALFQHCDIHLPRQLLDQLLRKYSFEALAGRKPGQEKKEAHYRKGISGDWENYLSDALTKQLDALTDNLTARLR
jgi:hypothetical protein